MNETIRYAFAVVTFKGSTLVETIQSLPKDARCFVIDNSITGWSLAKAWNQALDRLIDKEGYDAAIVMNDDVILQPETGRLLAEALTWRQFAEPRKDFSDKELLLITAYNTNGNANEKGNRWKPGPDFSCWCAGKRLRNVIGPFDEGFPLYFEDNDTHRRIQLAGYEAMSYTPYFHIGSGTMKSSTPAERKRIDGLFAQSKQRYLEKWGGMPFPLNEERFTTPWNGRIAAPVKRGNPSEFVPGVTTRAGHG